MTYLAIFIVLAFTRTLLTHAIAELFQVVFRTFAPEARPIACIIISMALAAVIVEIAVMYCDAYTSSGDGR